MAAHIARQASVTGVSRERGAHLVSNSKTRLPRIVAIETCGCSAQCRDIRGVHRRSEACHTMRTAPAGKLLGGRQSRTKEHRRIAAVPLIEVWPCQVLDR